MGFFSNLFSNRPGPQEPPVPDAEKKYYQPDSYYTIIAHPGTQFEHKVVTFEERKKKSYPSKNGLYVAEILLLEYCSYGTYPHPRNGYPGFWWFAYGIRNVGWHLERLAARGFIELNAVKNKYYLTEAGQIELGDNLYVPYMHKHSKKTTENTDFGPEFNVWSVNRALHQNPRRHWKDIADEQEAAFDNYHS